MLRGGVDCVGGIVCYRGGLGTGILVVVVAVGSVIVRRVGVVIIRRSTGGIITVAAKVSVGFATMVNAPVFLGVRHDSFVLDSGRRK